MVPERFRGMVYLIVYTDAGGVMEEWPNDGNNTTYQELYVTPQPLPDLVVSDVIAPVQSITDATVEVRYTVTNLGPGETPVDTWTETVWLTRDKNRPHPGQGDYLLKSLDHHGTLVNNQGYDVVTTVQIPDDLVSGTYYIMPWTDPYSVVLEDTLAVNVNSDDPTELDNNNYKARAINIIALQPEIKQADLEVQSVIVAPTGTGGEEFTIDWSVGNIGDGNAAGNWLDQIWLTDQVETASINTSNSLLLTQVSQSKLNANDKYDDSITLTLSPSAIGSRIVVMTDALRQVTESDEDNNRGSAETMVMPVPADLEIVSIEVPQDAKSGEETTLSFTIQNTGDHPVWPGTDFWVDYVWISADVNFIQSRASFFGAKLHSNTNPLQAGETYTAEITGVLPAGIGGDFFVYVHADAHDQTGGLGPRVVRTNWWPAETGKNSNWMTEFGRWAHEDPFNNISSAPFPVEFFEADLTISNLNVPADATSGQTTTVSYTVTNEGTRETRVDSWLDRVFLSRDPSLDRYDTMIGELNHQEDGETYLEIGESYVGLVDVRIPDGIDGDFYVIVMTDSPAGPTHTPKSNIGFGRSGLFFEDAGHLSGSDKLFESQRSLARGKVKEYQQEGNNSIATTIDITLATPPDLQVTQVLAPQRVRAGQSFDVDLYGSELWRRYPADSTGMARSGVLVT